MALMSSVNTKTRQNHSKSLSIKSLTTFGFLANIRRFLVFIVLKAEI